MTSSNDGNASAPTTPAINTTSAAAATGASNAPATRASQADASDTATPRTAASPDDVTTSAASSTAIVDRLLAQLQPGHVAFNAPQAVNIEQTVLVQLVVSPDANEATLRERIEGPGKVTSESVQVANMMQARLTGEGFRIVAQTPERQLVSSGVTEWAWEITPQAPGHHTLNLSLDALVSLDGQTVPRTLRTFRKPIDVDVTTRQRVTSFLDANGKWVWTTLLVPAFGWFAKKRKDAKAAKDELAKNDSAKSDDAKS
ncbi:hypothetical protein ACVWWW_002947 [Lysobacter sp. HA18]